MLAGKSPMNGVSGGERRAPLDFAQRALGAGVFSACALMAAALLLVKSSAVSLAVFAAGCFLAFLVVAPPFWLALLLVACIPFNSLVTQLLGGFESTARQWFTLWKEALIAAGILRALWDNPSRKRIASSNRWVLISGALLLLVYAFSFLASPSVPGIFAIALETRFIGVMAFFMFLELNREQMAALVGVMLWSIGLVAFYGLIQYAWDYERLFPLVYNVPDLFAGDTPRLYSYALGALEPGFDAVIGILIVITGAARSRLLSSGLWLALLIPCLLLTYTRSAFERSRLRGGRFACAKDAALSATE